GRAALRRGARPGAHDDPDGDGAAAEEGLSQPDEVERRLSVRLPGAQGRCASGPRPAVRREDPGRVALPLRRLPRRSERVVRGRAGRAETSRRSNDERRGGGIAMSVSAFITLNDFVSALLAGLWGASWQGALFIIAAWAICRAAPRLAAPTRCWLWWLVC